MTQQTPQTQGSALKARDAALKAREAALKARDVYYAALKAYRADPYYDLLKNAALDARRDADYAAFQARCADRDANYAAFQADARVEVVKV